MSLSMLCSWGLHQQALLAECRRQGVRIRYDGMRKEIGGLYRFAVPATVSGVLGGLAVVGANVLLVRQPGGFAAMAVLSAANTIRSAALVVPNIVSRVSQPLICNLRASGDARRYRQAIWCCMGFSGGLTGLVALALCPLSALVLSAFGKQYLQGGNLLRILLAGAVVEVIACALFQSLYAHGRIWTQCAIQALWSIVLLAGIQYFPFENGATNLAVSYLVAWTCSAILYGAVTRRLFRNPAMPRPQVPTGAKA
jgi:O-antigen/teichoic acid export membrane protein